VLGWTYVSDSHDLAHELFAGQLGDGTSGTFRVHHHDESESTRVLGVRVVHDRGLVDLYQKQDGVSFIRGGAGSFRCCLAYVADFAEALVQIISSDFVCETRDVQVHARVGGFVASPVVPVDETGARYKSP
jgi:hypothetical protein